MVQQTDSYTSPLTLPRHYKPARSSLTGSGVFFFFCFVSDRFGGLLLLLCLKVSEGFMLYPPVTIGSLMWIADVLVSSIGSPCVVLLGVGEGSHGSCQMIPWQLPDPLQSTPWSLFCFIILYIYIFCLFNVFFQDISWKADQPFPFACGTLHRSALTKFFSRFFFHRLLVYVHRLYFFYVHPNRELLNSAILVLQYKTVQL